MTELPASARQRARLGRREQILRAAVDVFALHGFEGASIRDVANASGMVKGNLYYYFPAKQDLLFEIVDDLHERFLARLATSSVQGKDALERLARVVYEHCVLVCERSTQTFVTYQNFRYLSEDRRAIIISKRDLYEHSVRALVAACRSEGHTCPEMQPAEATRAILGMTNWIYEWYVPSGEMTADDVARTFTNQALGVLKPCEILGHHHERMTRGSGG